MTKEEIISRLAEEKKVEGLLKNIVKGKDIETEDLTQDIYLELLSKPDEKIQELQEKDELTFFIVRMILNNTFSKNSPYFYRYERYKQNKRDLKDLTDDDSEF